MSLVELARFDNRVEADLARLNLEAEGIEAVLFDVWDNRQLGGLKNYVGQLIPLLKDGLELTPTQRSRAVAIAEKVVKVESFDELYRLLNFQSSWM